MENGVLTVRSGWWPVSHTVILLAIGGLSTDVLIRTKEHYLALRRFVSVDVLSINIARSKAKKTDSKTAEALCDVNSWRFLLSLILTVDPN